MISREQATEIAKRDALAYELGFAIREVLLPAEITSARPRLYNVPLDNVWIAYVEQVGSFAIDSSRIVVIDRRNGDVLYRGSAHDEG
jgi:hypothetical protein